MGRKKENQENDFFTELAGATGGQVFSNAGRAKYFIDTGNLALNYISSGSFVTGGLPGGKIIEVYGPPGSSKSLLAYSVLAGCQRMGGISVYLDCERAGNADFAKAAGHVDVDKLITYEPISIEQCEAKIKVVTKAIRAKKGSEVPICFVWDSIGVTPTEREWKEIDLPETYTKEQFKKIVGSLEKPGERARACGDMLRVINPFLDENNATLFIINQVRQKIGVMFGSDETTAGGGHALPFYASCRLRTSAHKTIEDKELEVPIGVNLKFTNKKNRSFTPFMKVEGVQLYFNEGVNPLGGLLNALLIAKRIENSGKGNYKVLEPWAEGKDVTFKSSIARGDVPVDVLIHCPKIVDAKDEEDIKKYLQIFSGAIALTNGDTITEKDVEDGSHLIQDTDTEE